MNYFLREFTPAQATQDEWAELTHFLSQIQAESLPDDPPRTAVDVQHQWTAIPPVLAVRTWTAHEPSGGAVIGFASLEMMLTETNRHISQANIAVLPGHRRQGLGSLLLGQLVRTARENVRSAMVFYTRARVPAGEAFVRRAGAQEGLWAHTNQLSIEDVNRGILRDWIERAAQRAAAFDLCFIDGPFPEELLEGVARVREAMNQQPFGDLEIEALHWTPDLVRSVDQSIVQRGFQRWCLVAQEGKSGSLAGFTEIVFNPAKPQIGTQGDTGVLEAYRNRGLGRWLKAAMLQKVLDEKPAVRFIRTENADSNAPMLKINQELGFKPYISTCLWQAKIDQLEAFLNERYAAVPKG